MPADPLESTRAKRLPGLAQALREDWAAQRMSVAYQPQVNLRSREIVRFEALLRWKHAANGMISPSVFIPVAEKIGLIWEIGQWVLQRACAEAATWPEPIGVAVNVSAISLRNPDLPATVRRALTDSGLAASRLELEVTESAEISMDAESLRILNAIRHLGVRVTIDDLDTGHACLRYLLDFSFDKIKLDGLYASALDRPDRRGKAAREIMRSIGELCGRLHIDSLAEGIETPEQLALVMQANFTEVQGFIFGPPVAAGQVAAARRNIQEIWEKLAIAPPQADAAYSFRQVADVLNDIVIMTNAEISAPGPTITYVNPAFTRLTGFTAAEIIGKTPRLLQGPGTSRQSLDKIRAALAEGRAVHQSILNYTKTGMPYWLDMRIEPLRDASGAITHFVGIQRERAIDQNAGADFMAPAG